MEQNRIEARRRRGGIQFADFFFGFEEKLKNKHKNPGKFFFCFLFFLDQTSGVIALGCNFFIITTSSVVGRMSSDLKFLFVFFVCFVFARIHFLFCFLNCF